MKRLNIATATAVLRAGEVIAYPTEAMYGLGCDPLNEAAVRKLLALKQRPEHKGLIVIGADRQQLQPLMGELPEHSEDRFRQTWPGPITWLVPASDSTPAWLTGQFETIALRVPDHPVCQALCRAFGPLVSTSANRSGEPPIRSPAELETAFPEGLAGRVEGDLGNRREPSQLRDLATDQVIERA